MKSHGGFWWGKNGKDLNVRKSLVTAPSRSPYWTLAFSMSLFSAITNLEFQDQNGKDLKRSFVIHRLNAVEINPTLNRAKALGENEERKKPL